MQIHRIRSFIGFLHSSLVKNRLDLCNLKQGEYLMDFKTVMSGWWQAASKLLQSRMKHATRITVREEPQTAGQARLYISKHSVSQSSDHPTRMGLSPRLTRYSPLSLLPLWRRFLPHGSWLQRIPFLALAPLLLLFGFARGSVVRSRSSFLPLWPRFLRHRLSFSLFLFASLITVHLLLATASFAQGDAASISGTIVDRQGGLVPDAKVSIINTDTTSTFDTKTNGAGVYNVPFLKPGHYRIVVTKQGFKQIDLRDLTLNVQDSVNRNFTLDVGATSETVQVNASAININTTDASVSTVIDRDFVANIPLNGRSLQDLLTLAPGVIQLGGATVGQAGDITVNGQRTEANAFSVDGVSANVGTGPGYISGAGFGGATPTLTALGTTQSMVSVDALQEFRATTSTYSAEYGRTPGGQFSFTTRSGTNDWHGSAFDYFRNEALDANNWFNDAEGIPKEKERQNDFGGTLSGPIRVPHVYNGKDKTFFFFSYEGLRLWTPQGLQTSAVPDQTLRQQAPAALQPILNAFPLPNKGEDGLNDGLGIYQVGESFPSSIDSIGVRVDHNFSDKFKIFGRYASTPSVSSYYSGATAVQTNSVINNRLVTLGVTNLVTSTQTNELRFNITQVNSLSNNVSTNLGGATPFDVTTLPGPNGGALPPIGSQVQLSLSFGGQASFATGEQKNAQRQYNVTDSYSWALGRHNLKFGIDWRRLTTYATPFLAYEFAYFTSEASVLANNVGSSGFIEAFGAPSSVEPLYRNFSAFAQDEWKVTTKLSLSLGLRWDVNPAPSNLTGPPFYTLDQTTNLAIAQLAPGGTPLWKTDWHGFAPRFGAAYELHQAPRHETVLRAGFGMFYDMGNILLNGNGGIGFNSSVLFSNASFPLSSEQMTLPPPSIAPPYNSYVNAFGPNLKLPYTLQWNLAFEQALGNKQALTLSYVGSAGRRLLETYDLYPSSNPNFASGNGLYITKNGPTSDYNALQAQFQRTLTHGLQALASYTFSHSIDDASSNFDLSDVLERASSDFDIRQNFQAALTYDVPGQYSNAVLTGFLEHWAFDARVMARSALPVDIVGGYGLEPGTGASVRFHPNLVPGPSLYMYGSQYPGGKIINYDAFTVPTSGPGFDSEGDTPRNYARGFGAWQMNFAIRRDFPIHERLHLQFRVEAFNLFNHPSFAGINYYWPSGPFNPSCLGCGFGGAGSTLNNSTGNGLNALYQIGGPRSLQIALKLIF
jgi:Carboxypeptidase regulatory-like domain/TonB dependent receptor